MFKRIDKTFRKDVIAMLRTSDESEHEALAKELEAAGPHGFMTDDEIERFMDIV